MTFPLNLDFTKTKIKYCGRCNKLRTCLPSPAPENWLCWDCFEPTFSKEGEEIKEIVWVVGEVIDNNNLGSIWEIIGIFNDEKDAIEACTQWNHFIGPIPMNTRLPISRSTDWPGCYFPKLEKATRKN